MNNAKMWLVVSPTVGVPLFLGAVAVGSFAVHLQVVKNTSWVSDFLQGSASAGEETASMQIIDESAMEAARVSYAMPAQDGLEVTVVLPDGTTTQAILKMPEADTLPRTISQ
jgi:light-harvesting protein B-800-850 alpha chain